MSVGPLPVLNGTLMAKSFSGKSQEAKSVDCEPPLVAWTGPEEQPYPSADYNQNYGQSDGPPGMEAVALVNSTLGSSLINSVTLDATGTVGAEGAAPLAVAQGTIPQSQGAAPDSPGASQGNSS
jgi:hypothetical protein